MKSILNVFGIGKQTHVILLLIRTMGCPAGDTQKLDCVHINSFKPGSGSHEPGRLPPDICTWNGKKCLAACDSHITDTNCNKDINCKYDYKNCKCISKPTPAPSPAPTWPTFPPAPAPEPNVPKDCGGHNQRCCDKEKDLGAAVCHFDEWNCEHYHGPKHSKCICKSDFPLWDYKKNKCVASCPTDFAYNTISQSCEPTTCSKQTCKESERCCLQAQFEKPGSPPLPAFAQLL